ncbi:MAG: ATP-binding cassette domain-containing protein [Candidatus Aenigmarchaeota archaeon]|nr:ATP-binding cassette domain-containing protein [Candidatus Aenigmarchaeota archaeon]
MKDIAIKVENISKTFKIPHEKYTSLKETALHLFSLRSYEVFEALKDVSFEIKKGEFFGIIGRNGSGKSTLLKIIAGIYLPTKGKVKTNGQISPFLELGVGFNPELTARENIFLGGSILGLSKKEIKGKFRAIIGFAELEEFIDMKFKNFSSGMQVRLAFSLAIHAHAEILLMDEVLAVGDSNFQNKCLEEFNKYRNQGKTVVLVTHDIGTIQKYCDRAVLFRNGEIVEIGNPEDTINAYIFQNMSDEEKRIVLDKKESVSQKQGSDKKIAEITKVVLLDKDRKEKNVFRTGEDISIKINFKKSRRPSESINIGIGIYKDDGSYILGYNTLMDSYKIKRNFAEVQFNNFPLLKGAYYINVVCFGEMEERYYDFKDKIKTFQIFPTAETSRYRGVVNVNHRWI